MLRRRLVGSSVFSARRRSGARRSGGRPAAAASRPFGGRCASRTAPPFSPTYRRPLSRGAASMAKDIRVDAEDVGPPEREGGARRDGVGWNDSTMSQDGPTVGPLHLDGYVVETDRVLKRVRVCMPPDGERADGAALAAAASTDKTLGNKGDDTEKGGADEARVTDECVIPEAVLQYERQMRKVKAASRAGGAVTAEAHLRVVHEDEHLVVVDKPSGVLTVPGVNHNPSILTVVHETFGRESRAMDSMIVHRLDMDTSGLVAFARTDAALRALHGSFRDRRVEKSYEALLCGHMGPEWEEGEIDLPLQRDHRFPPFMRVATARSEEEAAAAVKDLRHAGWRKLVKKRPKPSRTEFRVLLREMYRGKYPVTRVALYPVTGRTHQLRVHCAAIGHPIVADPSYGILGEAAPNGGLDQFLLDRVAPHRAMLSLQRDIDALVREEDRCMCLHARELSFAHPITGEPFEFKTEPPF